MISVEWMEEADDCEKGLLHLLDDCEKGLLPAGFESVDDEDGLEFPPADPLLEGPDISMGSSISSDECLAFSSEPSSDSELQFEDASQDAEMPGEEPYPGVDMGQLFNKRKPLEEQGQGLLANTFCFFAKLPHDLRLQIQRAIQAASPSVVVLAAASLGLRHARTVRRIATAVKGNLWTPVSKLKRLVGCRRRVATQTEEASGSGADLIWHMGFLLALP